MEKVQIQKLLDRAAISISALCILHCLATPVLLIAIPVISSTFLADEQFHRVLVAIILPVSVIAFSLGCRRHRDSVVLVLGGIGLFFLILVAAVGHDLLGEFGEKVGTIISGLILAAAHVRNYYLCRNEKCHV